MMPCGTAAASTGVSAAGQPVRRSRQGCEPASPAPHACRRPAPTRRRQHPPAGASTHLHGHAEALVQADGARALGRLAQAVDQAGELAALAGAHVRGLRGGRQWGRVWVTGWGERDPRARAHPIARSSSTPASPAGARPAPPANPVRCGTALAIERQRMTRTRRVRAKSSGYTMSRLPAPARPPEARLTAKNCQKSVLELYLGNRPLIVSLNAKLKACSGAVGRAGGAASAGARAGERGVGQRARGAGPRPQRSRLQAWSGRQPAPRGWRRGARQHPPGWGSSGPRWPGCRARRRQSPAPRSRA